MSSSAFFEALQSSNVQKCKQLLKKGKVDVNASLLPANHEAGFYPALCACAEAGLSEILQLLLENKAQVDLAVGCK
jgi:hypothetical protein